MFPLLVLFGCPPGDDTGPASETLGFDLTGAYEGATLSLTWVDAGSIGQEALVFGDVVWSAPAEARVETDLVPPDALLQVVDSKNLPDTRLAWFVPAVHVDADGDAEPSGEPLVGVGLTWPIYVDGPPPGEPAGLVTGWNAVTMRFAEGGAPVTADPLAIPVEAALSPVEDLAIGGTWAGAVPAGARQALVSAVAFGGGPVGALLLDEPAAASWTMAVAGAPPDDHVSFTSGIDLDGALEFPLAYADTDGSGGWTAGDGTLAAACAETSTIALFWAEPPTDLTTGLVFASQALPTGWFALRMNEPGAIGLDEATRMSLVMAGECTM